MRKARILFTISNFISAGSGMEMLNIIYRLDGSVFEPYVCVRRSGGMAEEDLRKRGYPVIVSPFNDESRNLFRRIWRIVQLAFFFRRYRFSIWHSFHWSSDFTEPIIARLAGAHYIYTKKNMNWSRSWKIKSILASSIVARNRAMLDTFFSSYLLSNKTVHITGGVDVFKFVQMPDCYKIRKKHSIPSEDYVLCQVAQILPIKGQHIVIQAIARIPGIKVFFAGAERNMEYAKYLRNLTSELGVVDRVIFLGSIKEVPELINESNSVVLATTREMGHEEGCPVALLEAMACAVPCIASNVAGSNDLIVDMKNGLLFEPGDVNDLVKKITFLFRNREISQRLAVQASKDVRRYHTLEMEAAGFQSLYVDRLRG